MKEAKDLLQTIAGYTKYKEAGKLPSEQFKYWFLLLDEIMTILRDLTCSRREGNWRLHFSAVRRSLPLFIAFVRTNYSCWVPLYYEECIALEKKFPRIYESFVEGGFVVWQTAKCGSAVPMDQALEKEYNKLARGQGGIIGFSHRKEAVAQWNIIKHKKARFVKHLWEVCCLTVEDEYSLRHEFSMTLTEADEECVQQIAHYIRECKNLFDTANSKVTTLVTGKEIDEETASSLLSCIRKGEECYKEFRTTRLFNIAKKLFYPIPKIRRQRIFMQQKKSLTLKKKTYQPFIKLIMQD